MRVSLNLRWMLAAAVASALLAVAGESAAQQQPPPPDTTEVRVQPRPDTAPRPTPRRDPATPTARADTLAPGDTVPVDPADAEAAEDPDAEPARDTSPDEVIRFLRTLEGYEPVEYTAERAEFRAPEREMRLYGSAEVERGRDRIEARDTLVYRERDRMVAAYGEPRVRGEGNDIVGDVMFYDLDRSRAIVRHGRTEVAEMGATWFIEGEDVAAEGRERLYARGSTFTSDDRPEPQYHFQSDRVLVINDRILVGRPARLYFRNVPVAWLPFIVQDMTRGRRSGLLTPQFGINDIVRTSSGRMPEGRGGTGRQISNLGFYWAINDYLDARLAGEWRSGVSTGLAGNLRYNWRRQFLTGELRVRHDWRDEQANVLGLNTSNTWDPTERTRVRLSGDYVSSSSFVRETNPDPLAATQDLRSNVSVDQQFDWGRVGISGNRRQSLIDDGVEMTLPQISINPNTITLFRPTGPARWYNNATFNISGSASRATTDPGLRLSESRRERVQTRANATQSFSVGNLSWSSSGQFNRTEIGAFDPADLEEVEIPDGLDFAGTGPGGAPSFPSMAQDDVRWNSSLAYRIGLVGSTSVSPTLSVSQEILTDTAGTGGYVSAPARIGFGSSVNTDLYGFFPGVGGFSTFRHRVSPRISYTYNPAVELDETQRRVFGDRAADPRNRIQLTVNQTIEGRPRRERQRERPPEEGEGEEAPDPATLPDVPAEREEERTDEIPAERAGEATPAPGNGEPAEDPEQPRPVTILGIDMSAMEYDFARAQRGLPGFTTEQLRTTITSDYLRGLRLSFNHELFDRSMLEPGTRDELGIFAPRLSSFETSFRLGPESPPIRFLLGLLGYDAGSRREPPGDQPPADQWDEGEREREAADPFGDVGGMPTATASPRGMGGGRWGVDLRYSFRRDGRSPGTDPDRPADQSVDATTSFSPTPNWSVNWRTRYSITEREFGDHMLTLSRDLYRWEANFSFHRSVHGASLFSVSVRLRDLPDLKFEHKERGLGGQGGPGTGPGLGGPGGPR